MVEDNIINQTVAARTLENLGYRVDVAANGLEAVEATAAISYAAVLMDCQMPERDGFAATAAIRAREPAGTHLPIIAMTAGARSEDEARCLAAGMDDYLTKPVDRASLTRLLRRWVSIDDPLPLGEVDEVGSGHTLEPQVLAQLQELAAYDPTGIAELTRRFLEDSRRRLDDTAAAAARHDYTAVAGTAHSLKGSSGNLAAHRMASLCGELEAAAGASDAFLVAEVLRRLEDEFERVAVAIRRRFHLEG